MRRPLIFEIPGPPIPQARPRASVIAGRAHIYEPKESKEYKERGKLICTMAAKEQDWEQTDRPIDIVVSCYFEIPKSKTKKFKREVAEGKQCHTVKPDIDNLAKIVLDLVTASDSVWNDDAQVVECHCFKYYGSDPKVVVKVYEHGERYE